MRAMTTTLIAAASALFLFAGPVQAQDTEGEIYRVEEVVVEGRRLDEAARAYISAAANPVPGRGPARWDQAICVAAANFDPAVGQYLVDRVSDVAREIGLRAHEPDCHPSVVIIGTVDGAEFTRQFVGRRPKLFVVGGSGMDQGLSALERFQDSDAAVRWWHVSVPVDDETGRIAVRLPGLQVTSPGDAGGRDTELMAPIVRRNFASRLREPHLDVMKRSFVIVDVDRLQGVTLEQLADFIAFVALAQVDPEADLSRFDSILNLFQPGGRDTTGLSPWDRAYLDGLYDMRTGFVGRGAQTRALARSILDAYTAQVPVD